MGGLTGGLAWGLEIINSLIIAYLAENRGGLGKKIENWRLKIENQNWQLGYFTH